MLTEQRRSLAEMVPGVAPFFPEEDRRELLPLIDTILATGALTQGRYVAEFEKACAKMAGTRYAIAVNSGGMALQLVLEALDVTGGEVIVPTDTFVATPNSAVRAGATPVFVDVSADNLAIDPDALCKSLTIRTRAVILVHMFGVIGEQTAEIQQICGDAGVALIEDAAHAHGAMYRGVPAGRLGAAACFSYYATKILTSGEGGSITTDSEELAETVRSLRDHGRARAGSVFDRVGNNFRLTEIAALLGVFQHRRLDEVVRHRRAVASAYREVLTGVPGLNPIDPEPREGHVYWRYPVLLARGVDRLTVQSRMAQEARCRVTWMYEPLCHEQPYYASRVSRRFPTAEDVMSRLINLPTHPGVAPELATRIARSLVTVVASEMSS